MKKKVHVKVKIHPKSVMKSKGVKKKIMRVYNLDFVDIFYKDDDSDG
jgi:hypothetical protein